MWARDVRPAAMLRQLMATSSRSVVQALFRRKGHRRCRRPGAAQRCANSRAPCGGPPHPTRMATTRHNYSANRSPAPCAEQTSHSDLDGAATVHRPGLSQQAHHTAAGGSDLNSPLPLSRKYFVTPDQARDGVKVVWLPPCCVFATLASNLIVGVVLPGDDLWAV